MVAALRERRADSRVILRIGVYTRAEPHPRADERGRHTVAGPPEWIAARLSDYVEAGCNGFVVNLDYEVRASKRGWDSSRVRSRRSGRMDA